MTDLPDPIELRAFGRVLVTNDDGVDSPGLAALAAAAGAMAAEVVVVAPAAACSGTGTAVQRRTPLPVGPPAVVPVAVPRALAAYAVDGWPAEAVLLAFSGAVGPPPDLVLCGVNEGPNIGAGMIHSGTVGAALTAVSLGCPAVAISLDDNWFLGGRDEVYGPGLRWDVAAALGIAIARSLAGRPGAGLLAVNVPSVGPDGVAGVRAARLAPVRPAVRPGAPGPSGAGRPELALPAPDRAGAPDTDAVLLAARHVTVSGWPDADVVTAAVAAGTAELALLRTRGPAAAPDQPGAGPVRPLSPSTDRTARSA